MKRIPPKRVSRGDFVSIVIICFNQGHFLDDAIESVLAQTVHQAEIVVVDDGSTDSTADVVRSYPQASYIYQNNQGISAARNAGLRASTGGYVAFLDADDRLLPKAAEAGLHCLRMYPESGFVFGRYHRVNAHGVIMSAPNRHADDHDFYVALLQRNLIGMQSTVLYPRHILQHVGGFDERLRCCEDYDLFLRIARQFPVNKHDEVVAEYRRHDQNMSQNYCCMMETILGVLNDQKPYVSRDSRYREALKSGISNWRRHYGTLMVQDFRKSLEAYGLAGGSMQRLGNLASSYPEGLGLVTKNILRTVMHRSLGMRS